MNNIIIPRPLHIVVDDMGWFCAKDDRAQNGPSRTGVTRNHCYKDYIAINQLGKQLNMKISCAFVLGEWDTDNRLRAVKCLSKYGENWNNAAYVDKEELEKCKNAINSSEYIDIAVHGLLHGYYAEGIDNTDESDYYFRKNGELFMVESSEIKNRLDCFFGLLEYHNINKRINSFVPPSFSYRFNELSKILKIYGIEYVSTIFATMEKEGKNIEIADIEDNGIVNIDRNNNQIEWNQFASDLSVLGTNISGVLGLHWPNLLHKDPNKNDEVIEKAVSFFNDCSNNFGTILSEDMGFLATQSLFYRFAKVNKTNSGVNIDISAVPNTKQTNTAFYVSAKEPIKNWLESEVKEYQTKDGFITYKIKPLSKIITLNT